MTMSSCWCAFCGRGDGETALHRSVRGSAIAICVYCARAAIRALDEPDAPRDVVVSLRPRPAENG
jgi:hypothetical protein